MDLNISAIRPLGEQFDKITLCQIRELQRDIIEFPLKVGGIKYYTKEIVNTLEAGLLLASIHLTCSFAELVTRNLLILQRAKESKTYNLDRVEIEIEDSTKPQWGFSSIVTELKSQGVIDSLELELLNKYYRELRIPLHHALTRRFLRDGEKSTAERSDELFENLFNSRLSRDHQFEEKIESNAIGSIMAITSILSDICHKNGIPNR